MLLCVYHWQILENLEEMYYMHSDMVLRYVRHQNDSDKNLFTSDKNNCSIFFMKVTRHRICTIRFNMFSIWFFRPLEINKIILGTGKFCAALLNITQYPGNMSSWFLCDTPQPDIHFSHKNFMWRNDKKMLKR